MNDKDICADILTYVHSKERGVGFYQIARRFGLPNVQYDLPALIEKLVADGCLRKETAESGNDVYVITESGYKLIAG
ncbi:hypothetical protein [Pseudomonas indica]|uniref:hypothetical protein n=1 Tax=Pseudomonas indica TaxID=137658 RepID=UPI003FD36C9C